MRRFNARVLPFVGLTAITVLVQLGSPAKAVNRYFDRNGTTSGFGANSGFYSWEGNFWNNNDPSGTTATTAWTENDSPIFFGKATITVTASANHSIAGLAFTGVNQGCCEAVSINGTGGSVLTLTSNPLGQVFTTPGGLTINAPLASDTLTPLIWNGQGTLSLYGNNNSLTGGIVLNDYGYLQINNPNSFGTGPITFGGGATVYQITSWASSQAMTFHNAVTGPTRNSADAALIFGGSNPVTFTDWTLGTGTQMRTNTFILINSKLILGDGTTGVKGDANSGLAVSTVVNGSTVNGTLVVNGASTYGGNTTIGNGEIVSGYATLQADDGVGLPTNSFLILNGGVLQTSGSFLRGLASSGASHVRWNATGGGFSAIGSPLTVNLGASGGELVWGDNIGSQIVGPLKFGSVSSSATTLFVNGIDLNNSGTAATRTVTVTAGVGGDLAEMSGVIRATSGAGADLQKDGTGTLILSAANTYAGTTLISGGALQAVDGVGLPSASFLALNGGVLQGNGTFTRALAASGTSNLEWTANGGGFSANGGTFNVNVGGANAPLAWGDEVGSQIVGGLVFGSNTANAKTVFLNAVDMNKTGTAATRTVTVNKGTGGDSAEMSGVLSNSGNGEASLLKNGEGTLVLSNANTYSGGTTVTAGTLAIGSDDALGPGKLVLGAVPILGAATIMPIGPRSVANNIVLTGNGTIGGTDSLTFNGTFINASSAFPVLTVSNTGGVTFNQAFYRSDTATSGKVLSIAGGGNITFNGPIQNYSGGPGLAGTLSFAGYTGTATINGTNTYTGLTTLGGTFVLGNNAAFGTSTIAMNGATISASIDLSGVNAIANTTVNLGGNNIFHGTHNLEFTGTVTATASRIITNNISTGILRLSGPVKLSNNATNNTLTFTGTGNTTINGPISNGGTSSASGLTVEGSGIVTMSGTNTYSGSTNVIGGTLLVNGSITSAVAVASAATLGGTGTIAGNVTNNGIISPGASIGELHAAGNVTMADGSALAIELGVGMLSDRLAVTGNLDLQTLLDTLLLSGEQSGGPWTIATYGGNLVNAAQFDNVVGMPPGYAIDYGTGFNSQIRIVAAPVPEPHCVALLLIGAGSLALRRRASSIEAISRPTN
jgi:autotransporter-associated beta strand protein